MTDEPRRMEGLRCLIFTWTGMIILLLAATADISYQSTELSESDHVASTCICHYREEGFRAAVDQFHISAKAAIYMQSSSF